MSVRSVTCRSVRVVQHRHPLPRSYLIAAAAKKRVIDADVAEFIDDDGRAFTFRRGQKTAQERRLSRAEKAGNDGHRNTRAAGLLEPAPEWSRFSRGKEIEQPCSLFPLRRHRARKRTT
jgi:hypothetical protein